MRTFIIDIPGYPIWKSFKIFYFKTAGITTRSQYNNIQLQIEKYNFLYFFWSIISLFYSNKFVIFFTLNFISFKLTGSSSIEL